MEILNDFEYTYLIKAVAADGRTSFSNAHIPSVYHYIKFLRHVE